MQRILIIEDDTTIRNGIQLYLQKKRFAVDCADTIAAANALLAKVVYHLILLDIRLPDGNGLELCSKLRETSTTPIIFLTANDTEEQMITGFQHGCDDYLAKPFSIALLYQRILAVLRRSQNPASDDIFSYLSLTIDFTKMQALKNDVPVKLSAMEYKLLELLIRNRGQVLTRDLILERLWDCDGNFVDENTLRVLIRRLRQKLKPTPKIQNSSSQFLESAIHLEKHNEANKSDTFYYFRNSVSTALLWKRFLSDTKSFSCWDYIGSLCLPIFFLGMADTQKAGILE